MTAPSAHVLLRDHPEPQHPDVHVKLTGADGNVFNLIGLVSRALQKAGKPEAAHEFCKEAFESGSYGSVLRLIDQTVTIE